eukprot:gene6235-16180_t
MAKMTTDSPANISECRGRNRGPVSNGENLSKEEIHLRVVLFQVGITGAVHMQICKEYFLKVLEKMACCKLSGTGLGNSEADSSPTSLLSHYNQYSVALY